jgi:hypothetical protein
MVSRARCNRRQLNRREGMRPFGRLIGMASTGTTRSSVVRMDATAEKS